MKTFRDGWRTLRFFLTCSPRWLFLWPGVLSFVIGLVGYALALPGTEIAGAKLDVHTLLVASLALLIGQQAILFALFAKMFSLSEGLLPSDARIDRFFGFFTLEKGLALGSVAALLGAGLVAFAVALWQRASFGSLDYAYTMRFVIPGVTLIALGIQGILGSFMISIMSIGRR